MDEIYGTMTLKIECLVLQGRIEGKRSRGQQRIAFLDTTREVLRSTFGHKLNVAELFACAWDRRAWKAMTSDALYMHGTIRRRRIYLIPDYLQML